MVNVYCILSLSLYLWYSSSTLLVYWSLKFYSKICCHLLCRSFIVFFVQFCVFFFFLLFLHSILLNRLCFSPYKSCIYIFTYFIQIITFVYYTPNTIYVTISWMVCVVLVIMYTMSMKGYIRCPMR